MAYKQELWEEAKKKCHLGEEEIRMAKEMFFENRQEFVYCFFPFMFGIYPYTVVTEKQREAMKQAGVDYTYSSLYDLTFAAVKSMLKNEKD